MFDQPIVYAKSTNGLIFRNNTISYNNDFEPFHWNKHMFFFEKVDNVLLENNQFEKGFDVDKNVRVELSENNSVVVKQ